jgi:hypothetical protein
VTSLPEHTVPPTESQPHAPTLADPTALQSRYGFCCGRPAYARELSTGCWQVKVHEPQHPDAGLDGWRTAIKGSPSLTAASAASGFNPDD